MEFSTLAPNERVVLISGASSGIGLETTKILINAGYKLSIGVRNVEKAEEIYKNYNNDHILINYYNTADYDSIRIWIENTINNFSNIDALINNAGIYLKTDINDVKCIDDLNKLWQTNVLGPFKLTQEVLPHIRKSKNGRIINIASTDAKRYRETVSIGYSMVKHSLLAMSNGIRINEWENNVRVTALCPGAVETNLLNGIEGVTPSKNRIDPKTIGNTINYILSLPNNSIVSEFVMNSRLESSF